MISVEQAKLMITANIVRQPATCMSLTDAAGLVLAQDVYSRIDVPSFDNSAMDGYAIRYDAERTSYRITQHIQAGYLSEKPLSPDEAARIFTGASIPPGADTVVAQERCQADEGTVHIHPSEIQAYAHIRKKGEQCKTGERIAQKDSLLTPGLIALLASVGEANLMVYAPPKVSVLITGNELCQPGSTPSPGQIFNSNEYAIRAYIQRIGIVSVDILHVRDNASLLQQQVKKSLYEADVLLITGGISVGEHDYVHEALLHNNVKTLFYKVKQKPGKPMYCGRQNNKWVFALPGNPAAVLMCMNQYVIPCLKSMMGYPLAFHPNHTAPILNEWHKKDTLTHILKASLGTQGVTILNGQESFNLSSFAEANCFVQMPEDVAFFHKCDIVDVYLW